MNKNKLILFLTLTTLTLNSFGAAAPSEFREAVKTKPGSNQESLLLYLSNWARLWAFLPKEYRVNSKKLKNLRKILNNQALMKPLFDKIGLPADLRYDFITLLTFEKPGVMEVFGRYGNDLLKYLQRFITIIVNSIPNQNTGDENLSDISDYMADAENFAKEFRASVLESLSQRKLTVTEDVEESKGSDLVMTYNPIIEENLAAFKQKEAESEFIPKQNLELVSKIVEYGVDTGFTFEPSDFLPENNILLFLAGKKLSKKEAQRIVSNLPHLINYVGDFQTTPLIAAANSNDINLVEALIEAGADLNAQNEHGLTALHTAVFRGNLDMVKLLLKSGIDTSIKNKNGKTAAEISMGALGFVISDYDLVKEGLYKAAAPKILKDTPLVQDISKLINSYFPENKKELNEALTRAVNNADLDLMQDLITAGADVNTKAEHGSNTPLHTAVGNGNLDAVKLLLKHGANPFIINDIELTPIQYSQRNNEITKLLNDYVIKTQETVRTATEALPTVLVDKILRYSNL